MSGRSARKKFMPSAVVPLEERVVPSGVYTVTNLQGGYGQGSLGWAIQAANETYSTPSDPNTINFAGNLSGTIYETSGRLLVNSNVNINGPGSSVLTISGNDQNQILALTGGHINIAGLSFVHGNANGINGNGDQGGAIENYGATLGLYSDNFQYNHANWVGGAVSFTSSASDNSAIVSSTFSANSAQYGGAVNTWAVLWCQNDSFVGNWATVTGGAIEASPGKLQLQWGNYFYSNTPNDVTIA